MNKIVIPSLISVVMLALAIPEGWPYGYYTLLRFVVCASAIFIAYTAFELEKIKWTFLMGFIALLFNPLIPIYLTKGIWVVIDVVTAILFVIAIFIVRNKKYGKKI